MATSPSAPSSGWGEGVLDSSRTAGTGGRARFPGGNDLFRLVGILNKRFRSQPSASRGLKWNMFVSVFFINLILLRLGVTASESPTFCVTSSRGRRRPRDLSRPAPEEFLRLPQGSDTVTSFTLCPFRRLKQKYTN